MTTKNYDALVTDLSVVFGPPREFGEGCGSLSWDHLRREQIVSALDLCRDLDDEIIVSFTRWGLGHWQITCQDVRED
jgi:hypothetical protein